MNTQLNFKPRCKDGKEYGHSARGFLLPCCWMEWYETDKLDAIHQSLFNPELNLSNIEHLDEVLLSDEWLSFENSIRSYETAPDRCKLQCSRKDTKKYLDETYK